MTPLQAMGVNEGDEIVFGDIRICRCFRGHRGQLWGVDRPPRKSTLPPSKCCGIRSLGE